MNCGQICTNVQNKGPRESTPCRALGMLKFWLQLWVEIESNVYWNPRVFPLLIGWVDWAKCNQCVCFTKPLTSSIVVCVRRIVCCAVSSIDLLSSHRPCLERYKVSLRLRYLKTTQSLLILSSVKLFERSLHQTKMSVNAILARLDSVWTLWEATCVFVRMGWNSCRMVSRVEVWPGGPMKAAVWA